MIVFFDGVCGLCNNAVNYLMARDQKKIMTFAPLQGQAASAQLTPSDVADLNSIVIIDGDVTYRKSEAVLHVLSSLSPSWNIIAKTLSLVPLALRDRVYGIVARSRYSLFGKRDVCRLPTPEERSRFLD